MMQSGFRLPSGILAVLLAGACSSSAPRGSPTRQGVSDARSDPGSGHASVPNQSPDVALSDADVDKAMRKRGYKPATYRGERVYCRKEALTGSNLQSEVCQTAEQIENEEQAARNILNGNRPAGCLPRTGCN